MNQGRFAKSKLTGAACLHNIVKRTVPLDTLRLGRIWDESGTNREIRGTTGANDIIFFRQANKDLNDLINKKAIIRKGEKKGIYYEFI